MEKAQEAASAENMMKAASMANDYKEKSMPKEEGEPIADQKNDD